jgi:hypothetical protein
MTEVKITIEGEGISVIKYTTEQKAGQIISFLGTDQQIQTTASPGSSSPVSMPLLGKKVLPIDMIEESEAKTFPQKIAALAKYIRDVQGQLTFSPSEIKLLLKKLGDDPKNFSRDMREASERGYIDCENSASDLYELTVRGDRAYADRFKNEISTKRTGAKRSGGIRGIRDEVRELEIKTSLENFPSYHDLSTKADKILWVLEYAEAQSIKGLSPTEIDHISGELRERIESKSFTALNTKNLQASYVKKTPEGYFRIEKKGSEYLKTAAKE